MSGFLERVAARASGRSSGLRPRVQARFEPAGFEEVVGEVPSARAAAAEPAVSELVSDQWAEPRVAAAPVEPDRRIGVDTARVEAAGATVRGAARDAPAAPVVVAPVPPALPSDEAREPLTGVSPVVGPIEVAAAPRGRVPVTPSHPQSLTRAARVEPAVVAREARVADRVPGAVAAARVRSGARGRETSITEPVVNVTIGRVEVRAERPQPPATPRVSRERETRLTPLEEYVAQRARGTR